MLRNEWYTLSGIVNLQSKTKPDYPAAANYFRKYAEEILKPEWLNHETRSAEDDSVIQGYQLTKLAKCIKNFLRKIKADTTLLEELEQFLPSLLHPLSHHDLASPIYKGELNEIQSCLAKLTDFMVEVESKCKMVLPPRLLKLTFELSATNHGYYEIQTNEPLYLTDNGGVKTLSDCHCTAKTCYRISGVSRVKGKNFKADDATSNYTSVEDAYEKIYAFIHGQPDYSHVPKAGDYKTEFIYADEGTWKPFQDLTA